MKNVYVYEVKNFIKSKAFIILTTLVLLLIIGINTYPRIKSGLNKDISKKEEVYVAIDKELVANEYMDALKSIFPNITFKQTDKDIDELKVLVKNKEISMGYEISKDNDIKVVIASYNVADIAFRKQVKATIKEIYEVRKLREKGLSQADIDSIKGYYPKEDIIFVNDDNPQNMGITYIFIIVLYMQILIHGQMVGVQVASEKNSRVMEVLITSVKPTSMLIGKVLASATVAFFQLALIIATGGISYKLNEEFLGSSSFMGTVFNTSPRIWILGLILMVLGFLIYAFLFAAIASTVSKIEEASVATMPIIFCFIGSFVAVMTALPSGGMDSLLMKVLSFIPLSSPLVLIAKVSMIEISIIEMVLYFGVLIISLIIIAIVSGKIFRVGVLLYGKKMKIKEFIKAIKKA